MKKAMVERLKAQYEISWFPEDGENFPVRVFLMKDEVTVGLDSTGESLHKRGYRKLTAKAPIAENLAAALIELTPWNAGRSWWIPSAEAAPSLLSSHDGGQYGTRQEPQFYGGRMAPYHRKKGMV